MLKITELLELPASNKNESNSQIVRFDIDNSNN